MPKKVFNPSASYLTGLGPSMAALVEQITQGGEIDSTPPIGQLFTQLSIPTAIGTSTIIAPQMKQYISRMITVAKVTWLYAHLSKWLIIS